MNRETQRPLDVEASPDARFALAYERLADQDRERMEWLNRTLARHPERDTNDDLCPKGHLLDGLKTKLGRPFRYCLTCHRERERLRRRTKRAALTAGLAPACEEG